MHGHGTTIPQPCILLHSKANLSSTQTSYRSPPHLSASASVPLRWSSCTDPDIVREYRNLLPANNPTFCRHRLLHIKPIDRQSHTGSLSFRHPVEMNRAVFTSDPDTGHQARRKAINQPSELFCVVPVFPPIGAVMP